MSLRVLHPGAFSLLVDTGRTGSRSLGVPLGGAADRTAFAIANALIRNPDGVAALEITLSGPTLLAEAAIAACVFGAPFEVHIDGVSLPAASVFFLGAGQILRIGGTPEGARGYLAVSGGFVAKPVLSSRTAFAPIVREQVLGCGLSSAPRRSLSFTTAQSWLDDSIAPGPIRVLDGPQADWFPSVEFYQQTYAVSNSSDRMGIRLNGTPLPRADRELVSEPVAPGAVQVTGEGLPIILGVDGQTIGGYPKIAHVVRADLDRLAQLRPHDRVQFRKVKTEEAESIAARRLRKLRSLLEILAAGT